MVCHIFTCLGFSFSFFLFFYFFLFKVIVIIILHLPRSHGNQGGNSGAWGLQVLQQVHQLLQSFWDPKWQDSIFVLKLHTAKQVIKNHMTILYNKVKNKTLIQNEIPIYNYNTFAYLNDKKVAIVFFNPFGDENRLSDESPVTDGPCADGPVRHI